MKLQKKTRPRFALWRYEHNLTLRETADALELIAGRRICSHEMVRTLCLPFDDAERSEPDEDLLAAIDTLTEGEIGPADFRAPVSQAA